MGAFCLSRVSLCSVVWMFLMVGSPAAAAGMFSPTEMIVCPGTEARFFCVVVDPLGTSVTFWKDNFTMDTFALAHQIPSASDTNGPFTAQLGVSSATSYPSTFTATATAELDNTFVQCFGPTLTDQVGNGTLYVVGPPSKPVLSFTPEDITSMDSTSRKVLIHWSVTDPYPDFISHYTITASPVAVPCGTSCVAGRGASGEYEFILSVGQEYTFRVRAENCDNSQSGPDSDSLTLQLKVPDSTDDCSSTPTYDQATGLLQSIAVSWNEIASPGDIAPGITGNLTGYDVTFNPDVGAPEEVTVNPTVCRADGICQYVLALEGFPPSYTSVTVAGVNVVGVGAARVCATQTISSTNNLIAISVDTSTEPVTVSCQFLDDFPGLEQCTVAYGTHLASLTATATSAQTGRAGDTVTIMLTSLQISSGATYYYSVTAGAVAQVEGLFRSACNEGDLGNTTTLSDPRCSAGDSSVTIENGVVCYGSTDPGSAAQYVCDSGYQLDGNSERRECQTDGQWSLPVPECVVTPPPESNAKLDGLSADDRVATYSCDSALYELQGSSSIEYVDGSGWPDAPECKVVGWIVFLIILVLVMAVSLLVQGIVIVYLIIRLKRQGHMKIRQQVSPCETVEMKANTSYGPVQVQSHTHSQGPADYEQPVNMEQAKDGENAIYEDI